MNAGFELAMKTLNGLLDQNSKDSKDNKPNKNDSRDALSLYEKAQANDTAPVGKINPI